MENDRDLLIALDDPDAHTRARAAAELARRGHADGLAACLAVLGEAVETTHAESTPVVWALVEIGEAALPGLLDRLLDEDETTRLRAAHATEQITKRRFGFDGNRWPDGAYEPWAQWWREAGYRYDATRVVREAAAARLRAQLSST